MSIEIQPKTNLLASFSQTKVNYQNSIAQPSKTVKSEDASIKNDPKTQLQTQPNKDEYISSKTKQENKNSIKDMAVKYGGLVTGSAAIITSAIGIPLAYKKGKKANTQLLNGIQESITDLSGKIKKLDIEKQIKEAVEEATKHIKSETSANTTIPVSKQSILTTALLGIGTGLGINEFLKNNKERIKEQGFSEDEINTAKNKAISIIDNPEKAINKANEVTGIANEARSVAYEARNTAYAYDGRISEAMENARDAKDAVSGHTSPLMKLYTEPYYDLRLMTVLDWQKKIDVTKSAEAMKNIESAASIRLDRSAEDTIRDIKNYKEKHPQLTSQWAITAEYAPIKKGGLGVVPVDLQDNFEKMGIDAPTFVPMYLKKNQGEFKAITEYNPLNDKTETQYTYKYGKDVFKLDKLAEINIPTYRNGKQLHEKVEFFSTKIKIPDSDKTKTLIFVKNNDYFKDDLYDSTTFAEETEKFAFLTKAVYTLAKYKVASALNSQNTGVENIKIIDNKAFKDVKAPNSMILNDWHAGSMAGLLRYRAPMEYAYNELDKNVYEAMKDMPLLMIGHNLGVQGNTNGGSGSLLAKNHVTENVINTLYDNYAIAITQHAESGLRKSQDTNDDMWNTVLLKRKTGDKHYNNLFLGASLADWFEIVSPNHANECINDPMQSRILYPLLQRRKHTGTIGGILNGLDKNKVNMKAISKNNYVKGLELNVYDENTPIDEVMEKRRENKRLFYQQYFKPLVIDKNYKNGPEIVRPDAGNTYISEEDFLNAPLISFAHRLSSQKDLKHLKGATFKLFDNWENLFPGKPMPIILAGGPPESADELVYLNELKNPDFGSNKARIDRTIALKGNLPNPAIMSASTFFMGPSDYEPCGLIQGECFAKGTPVIATDVGGFHDTIVDGVTGFLAAYPSEDAVYDKMVEALKMYFYDYDSYKQMVANDLQVDFSWNQPGKKGSIFEYTDKLGFNREDLPEVAVAA